MASCYAEDVHFSDPVFTDLRGTDAGDMWRMLCAKAQDFALTFEGVAADEYSGRARWVATYVFSQTGKTVVNHIDASFVFRDGKIVEHHDRFDLWRWAAQALGSKGRLLGWLPPVQNAIRQQAANGALYCGISDDPHKRFAKHQSGKGARFFHSSPAQALVYIESCASKGDALRRERAIKALAKAAKEALVAAVVIGAADGSLLG